MLEQIQAGIVDLRDSIAALQAENRLLTRYVREMMNASAINLDNSMLLTKTKLGRPIFIDGREVGSTLEIATSGMIEPANMRVLQRCFMPGVTFLDIGANFGFYTIMASSQIGNRGKIYAFEANPNLIPYLERSASLNGLSHQLTIVNQAISDHSGIANFGFYVGESGGGSLARGKFAKEADIELRSSRERYLQVPLARIDDVLPPGEIVDVVKVDVEGNEGSVLRGMKETIARSPNIQILMEFAPVLLDNDRGAADVLNELSSAGLKYWRVDPYGHLEDVSDDDLIHGESCDLLAARTKPDDRSLLLPKASLTFPKAPESDGSFVGRLGEVLVHGPYWSLQRGAYDIQIVGTIEGCFSISFAHEFGFVIATGPLTAETKSLRVHLDDDLRFFEVIIRSMKDSSSLALDYIVIQDA